MPQKWVGAAAWQSPCQGNGGFAASKAPQGDPTALVSFSSPGFGGGGCPHPSTQAQPGGLSCPGCSCWEKSSSEVTHGSILLPTPAVSQRANQSLLPSPQINLPEPPNRWPAPSTHQWPLAMPGSERSHRREAIGVSEQGSRGMWPCPILPFPRTRHDNAQISK